MYQFCKFPFGITCCLFSKVFTFITQNRQTIFRSCLHTDRYDRILLQRAGSRTGRADASGSTEAGEADSSGADRNYLEASEFYMEIDRAESDPV